MLDEIHALVGRAVLSEDPKELHEIVVRLARIATQTRTEAPYGIQTFPGVTITPWNRPPEITCSSPSAAEVSASGGVRLVPRAQVERETGLAPAPGATLEPCELPKDDPRAEPPGGGISPRNVFRWKDLLRLEDRPYTAGEIAELTGMSYTNIMGKLRKHQIEPCGRHDNTLAFLWSGLEVRELAISQIEKAHAAVAIRPI